jgi:hypothetical protein
VTSGVSGRGVSLEEPTRSDALLFVIRGANFQLTTDQPLQRTLGFTNYVPTKILAKHVSGGASVACAGGIYTAASKGGSAIVAAAQSWLNLTGAGKIVDATLAAVVGTDVRTETPILSLTTGSTAAVTADVYVFGVILD